MVRICIQDAADQDGKKLTVKLEENSKETLSHDPLRL